MKKFLLLALVLATAAFAQTYTAGPEYPWRVQTDVTLNTDGSLKSAPVQTFFRQDLTAGDKVISNDTGNVSWDAVTNSAKTVTVGEKTYTYGEVLAAVVAIAQQERAAQLAAQVPASP